MGSILLVMSILAINTPLLNHGEGLAFAGFVVGGAYFLFTWKGRRGARRFRSGSYAEGRYSAMLFFRWILLAVGVVGLILMVIAVL